MLVAGIGDIHGHWADAMIWLETACSIAGISGMDLAFILQVGDAEPLHSEAETQMVPGPSKYRLLGDFAEVLSGHIVIPAPLYFIAGNHEPFAAFDADGGLAAGGGHWGPNATYLGRAGFLNLHGLGVAFLSGVYSEKDFFMIKRPKKAQGKTLSHYNVSELTKVRESARGGRVDLLVTHDWPSDLIEWEYARPVGDPNILELLLETRPILSLHGHMHTPRSHTFESTEIACLNRIGARDGNPMSAIGIWDIDPSKRVCRRLV